MVKKDDNTFMPTIAIPPGETIRENMKYLGMTQTELAARLNISTKHLSNVINGKSPITHDTALKLELVLGPGAKFWMNLETNYQLNKARLEKEEKLVADLEILKQIPYKEMSDFGWIKETNKRKERVESLRSFFGVAELSLINKSYKVAFRKHKQIKEIADFAVLAWLRKVELEGLSVDVDPLNRTKLKDLISDFRKLTLKRASEFYPELASLCAGCGVALVLVPYLPKTYICGATMWRKGKAIIGLSGKGVRADSFWFTFFHEIAHLIHHTDRQLSILFENKEEDEIDAIARNYLISENQYNEFLETNKFRNKNNIIAYARQIGIAPFILLGRLQHDGFLGYSNHNDLIPSYQIASKP